MRVASEDEFEHKLWLGPDRQEDTDFVRIGCARAE